MSEQTEEEYLIERLSKLLAEISVIVNGPQPMGVLWSYADLPQKVQALKDAAALNAQDGLVEALEGLLDHEPEHCGCGDEGCFIMRKPWDKARAALARAEKRRRNDPSPLQSQGEAVNDKLTRYDHTVEWQMKGEHPYYSTMIEDGTGLWYAKAEVDARIAKIEAECSGLRSLLAEQYERSDAAVIRMAKAEAEVERLRDALKEAGMFLHHAWCDVQMNDYSFKRLNKTMEVVDAAMLAAQAKGE